MATRPINAFGQMIGIVDTNEEANLASWLWSSDVLDFSGSPGHVDRHHLGLFPVPDPPHLILLAM